MLPTFKLMWIFLINKMIICAKLVTEKQRIREKVFYSFDTGDLGFYDMELLESPDQLVNKKLKLKDKIFNVMNDRESSDIKKKTLNWFKREDTSLNDYEFLDNESEQGEINTPLVVEGQSDNTPDYDEMYRKYLEEQKFSNKTMKYDQKANSSLLEDMEAEIENMAQTRNCSGDLGSGLHAFKCITEGRVNQDIKTSTIKQLLIFWTLFSVGVALFLWCTKGWCCCCCPFPFCRINKRLREIQRFVVDYPPGRWRIDDDEYEYSPSDKEIILYDSLSSAFMDV